MDKDNNSLDDLFYDFFKENIKGKGASLNGQTVKPHLSESEIRDAWATENIVTRSSDTFEYSTDTSTTYLEEDFRKKEMARMVRRSEEVDEILSHVPHWMIRWGISVFFLILIMLLGMSYFIKYPDVVKGTITLTSTNPPAEVVARSFGPLTIYVNDKTEVVKGAVIGLLKNDADYEDVKLLKSDLEVFKEKMNQGRITSLHDNYTVGEIQGAYSHLIMAIKTYELNRQSATNNQQQQVSLTRQVSKLQQIEERQAKRVTALQFEYNKKQALLKKRYYPLYDKGYISKEELEDKESETRNHFSNLQAAKIALVESQNRILDVKAQKKKLNFVDTDEKTNSRNKISNAYNSLVNKINQWEQRYLLKAPINGSVNYLQFVKNNMYVKPEQLLASIIPIEADSVAKNSSVIGELFIDSEGSGKVEYGQVVNIELHDFNKKEFGLVKGEVRSIGDIGTTTHTLNGSQATYKIDVALPVGLRTNLNKEIRFKYNMQGQAEIITKDVRLLERIFAELRTAVIND